MLDPEHPLAELLRRDRRYHRDAYFFVFEALRYAQEHMGLGQPASAEVEEEPSGTSPASNCARPFAATPCSSMV